MAYIRLHADAPPAAVPILYLAGGPGGSGLKDMLSERFKPYLSWLKFADIITFDQRGTGQSVPMLTCSVGYSVDSNTVATRSVSVARYQSVAHQCAEYWKAQGVDLTAYTTEESADDVASLANQLGVKQVRLFGASYGSHLGLSVLRRHPELLQRAVLGAIEGPDHTIKMPQAADEQLGRIAAVMRSDPKVENRLPDFDLLVRALIAKADAQPLKTKLASGQDTRITGFDLRLLITGMMSRRDGIEVLPALFIPAKNGNYTPLANEIARNVHREEVSAMGAVMDCASSVSSVRWKAIKREERSSLFGTTPDFPLPEWCSAWGTKPLPDSFRAPVVSSIPTLFIAGDLDSQTPPANAAEVKRGFRSSNLFLVHLAAHDASLFLSSEPLFEAITTFMQSGSAKDQQFEALPLSFKIAL